MSIEMGRVARDEEGEEWDWEEGKERVELEGG